MIYDSFTFFLFLRIGMENMSVSASEMIDICPIGVGTSAAEEIVTASNSEWELRKNGEQGPEKR